MGTFLTASASLMCPHGGKVIPTPGTFGVRLGGEPVVLAGDSFPVGGCAFNIAGVPHPCTTVAWIVTAQRSTMVQDAPLTTESVGLCKAADQAVHSMFTAAKELVLTKTPVADATPEVVKAFREQFFDSKLFWDPFAGGKFAQYFFHAVENPLQNPAADSVHRLVEEAQLFIEAAHSCRLKL